MANDFTENFRKAISTAIALNGTAHDPKRDSWGDTRGVRLPDAEEHMKTCKVKSMKGYTEEFNWSIYDSMNNDSRIAVKADITCECGTVENVQFLCADATLGTIMSWLLED